MRKGGFYLNKPNQAAERPAYATGDPLTSLDLRVMQYNRRHRVHHHNRYLHHSGIVCGLSVVPANDSKRPLAIRICPGYAIGCCGEEIEVAEPVILDVRDSIWKWSNPSSPNDRRVEDVHVGIRYWELKEHPVPIAPTACGCEDPNYQNSRIRDSFRAEILLDLPSNDTSSRFDLCKPNIPTCPQCNGSPYLVLAKITLPDSDTISLGHIENL